MRADQIKVGYLISGFPNRPVVAVKRVQHIDKNGNLDAVFGPGKDGEIVPLRLRLWVRISTGAVTAEESSYNNQPVEARVLPDYPPDWELDVQTTDPDDDEDDTE